MKYLNGLFQKYLYDFYGISESRNYYVHVQVQNGWKLPRHLLEKDFPYALSLVSVKDNPPNFPEHYNPTLVCHYVLSEKNLVAHLSGAFIADFRSAQYIRHQNWDRRGLVEPEVLSLTPIPEIQLTMSHTNLIVLYTPKSNISILVRCDDLRSRIQIASIAGKHSTGLFQERLLQTLFPNSFILYSPFLQPLTIHTSFHMYNVTGTTTMGNFFDFVQPYYFLSYTNVTKSEKVSFLGFVSSLDLCSWLILGCFLAAMFVTFSFLQTKTDFETFLLPIKIRLGQGVGNVPVPRAAFVAWLTACLFLTEQLRGSNIDKFNTPLVNHPPESLDDLIEANLSLYSIPMKLSKTVIYLSLNPTQNSEYVKTLQNLGLLLHYNLDLFLNVAKRPQHNHLPKTALERTQERVYRPTDRAFYVTYNLLTVIDMLRKNKHGVYIDTFDKVASALKMLKQLKGLEANKLHIFSQPLYEIVPRIRMDNMPASREYVTRRLLQILLSGLSHLWLKWNSIDSVNIDVQKAVWSYKHRCNFF